MPLSLTTQQKQTAFWVIVWLAFALLIYVLGPIMSPFVASAILAYALSGGVDFLDQRRLGRFTIPRTVSVIEISQACSGVANPILSRRSRTSSGTMPRIAARNTCLVSPLEEIR